MGQTDDGEVLWEVGHTEGNTDDRHDHNGNEKGTSYFQRQQDGTQDDTCSSYDGIGIPCAKCRYRGIAGGNQASVLQTNKGDEESDTHRDGIADVQGDGVHNGLAHLEDGEQDKEDTLHKDGCEGLLPSITHGQHEGVGKEGVESHA